MVTKARSGAARRERREGRRREHGSRTVPGPPPGRGGFSLVELLVAVVILAIGVLGLAATTGFIIQQVGMSQITTDRSAALQSVIEEVRALPFDTIDARQSGTVDLGRFTGEWAVIDGTDGWLELEFVTIGPGRRHLEGGASVFSSEVADTFHYQIISR